MNEPRVLSFDLDDTLWAVAPVMIAAEAAMFAWLQEQHPQLMRGETRDSLRAMRVALAERFPERSHDMTFLRRQSLQDMFSAAGLAGHHAAQAFEVFYAQRNRVRLYDDVQESLQRLRSRYRLFALSNGNADLKRCGLDHLFEGHITAIDAGAAKPDPRIFAHLLAEARVEAAQVLHVGDDPYADVVGAARSGLQSTWLNRDGKIWPPQFPAPARTIFTLREIE